MCAHTQALALLVATLGAATARADVWTVNWAGGANFTEIQPAIDAAADGDVVLVAPGTYAGFQIVDKDLRLIGTGSPRPRTGTASVTNLAASRVVVLAWLNIRPPTVTSAPWAALNVVNCAGPVRIQGCSATGSDGMNLGTVPKSGARIAASGDVIASECSMLGGSGGGGAMNVPPWWGWSNEGGDGIEVEVSTVALYGTQAEAGNSGTQTNWSCNCGCPPGSEGGHGALVNGSLFFAAGSNAYGGMGGSYQIPGAACSSGCWYERTGRGGDGVNFWGLPSTGVFVAVDLAGGDPGTDNCNYVWTAHPGRPFRNRASGSTAARYGSLAPTMDLPSLLQGTTLAQASFFGQPGDLVYVAYDATTSFNLALADHGVWHLPPPAALPPSPVGTLDASGQLAAGMSFPPPPPGAQNVTWFVQPIFVDALGARTLGTPWSTTVVP